MKELSARAIYAEFLEMMAQEVGRIASEFSKRLREHEKNKVLIKQQFHEWRPLTGHFYNTLNPRQKRKFLLKMIIRKQ